MKTHYEEMLYGGYFPLTQYFDLLKKELPGDGFGWNEFVGTKAISEMPLVMDFKGYPPQDISLVAHILFHQYSYYVGSGRTYEVTGDIAEMLLNTKLDVDSGLLKSPFREIIIVPPPGLLRVFNKHTGWHEAYTIYVNLDESADVLVGGASKILRVLVVGKANAKSLNAFDDAAFFFKIAFSGGNVFEGMEKYMEQWKLDPMHDMFSTENDEAVMPRVFQFTLNVLLYLTSQDADMVFQPSEYADMEKRLAGLKNNAKIRKLSQRMLKEPKLGRYIIGSSVKLSHEEKELYKSVATGKVRFSVGGHWRNQWYGPKEAQFQKPKWIRPYFKGPELAELIRNVGVIK